MPEYLDRLKAAVADRYAVERELGSGGMATVYLARDLKHERQVALKVLRPDLAAVLGVERFLREVRIEANLSHPHILPLYDSGEADGFLYYVMPYVDGESLRDKLSREGELPIGETVRILREVADALSHAHEQGVVHRDIKPDNVMLSGRHAMVTDFGVAKAVSQATGREQLTTAGVAIGTAAYMAPEQAAADPNVDHRADIYAFGVLAYEMLTGRPPFTGMSPQMVLAAHVSETAEPVRKHRPTVPEPLANLVMKCLEKKAADRWQSADQLLPQLEALATPSGGLEPTAAAPSQDAASSHASRRWVPVAAAMAIVALGVIAWLVVGSGGGESATSNRMALAVLPFTSVGADEASESFTVGIHDDLITQLSKISALRVISRTSVMEYRNTTKNMRQIGEELGVGTLLEGSVQRAGSRIRINAQLIDTESDEHLWAETYNRELTVENIFAIQSELSLRIASALQATLSPEEHAQIEALPTENLEAYEYYLRGNEYAHRGYAEEHIRSAIQMYQRATDVDGDFALAYAERSTAHTRMWWFAYDRTDERMAMAREDIERAVALDSTSGEVRRGLGTYYYRTRDYERALRELQLARRALPSDPEVIGTMAAIKRRQGRFVEAAQDFELALELDPLSPTYAADLGNTYFFLRRYEDAERMMARGINLGPDSWPEWYALRSWVFLSWKGSTDDSRRALEEGDARLPDDSRLWPYWVLQNLFERNYEEALGRLASQANEVLEAQFRYVVGHELLGATYALLERNGEARTHYDSARINYERAARVRPTDERIRTALGLAYARLDRKEDAIPEGRAAVDLMPISVDAITGPFYAAGLAQIYTMVGEYDAAVEILQRLLDIPSYLSPEWLRLDPRWDALRDHPGFQELVRGN